MNDKQRAATLLGIAAILLTTLFLMVWVATIPPPERTLPGPIPSWWLNGESRPAE